MLYLDPKVAAGCIAELDSGIVMVRRSIEPGYGKWVFPGGYVDRGEKVEQAACREMLEAGTPEMAELFCKRLTRWGVEDVISRWKKAEPGGIRKKDRTRIKTNLPHSQIAGICTT